MADAFRWFVLQAIDPEMGCRVLKTRFRVEDASKLRRALGLIASDDLDLEYSYSLDQENLTAITSTFGVSFEPGLGPVSLVPWHQLREVPYLVHTGFELALMLEGRKPLAIFSDVWPCEWLDDLIHRFDRYVDEGRIISHVVDVPAPVHCSTGVRWIREVYVSLPGHEWRINAYMLLRKVGTQSGWNDALERYEGSLLGSEDWQNDWWANYRRRLFEERPVSAWPTAK
jgi:hypothetical protein